MLLRGHLASIGTWYGCAQSLMRPASYPCFAEEWAAESLHCPLEPQSFNMGSFSWPQFLHAQTGPHPVPSATKFIFLSKTKVVFLEHKTEHYIAKLNYVVDE